jgi:hypothetical protein
MIEHNRCDECGAFIEDASLCPACFKEKVTVNLSKEQFRYLKHQIIFDIEDFYDNPYGACDGWPDPCPEEKKQERVRERYQCLRRLCNSFDIPFEPQIKSWCTDYELTRVNNILLPKDQEKVCCACQKPGHLVDGLECRNCSSEPPEFWDPDPELKPEEVLPGIFCLSFSTRAEMCSAFLRFQEHYESPEYAGKIFTLGEFKEWYRGDKKVFTYYEDWSGFNIPSWVFQPFKEGKFKNLTSREKWLLDLFVDKKEPFYVIAIHGDDDLKEDTLKHEIAHGMFYTNSEYRQTALKALKGLKKKTKKKLKKFLRKEYAETSIVDEMHAYTLEGLSYLKDNGIKGKDLKKVSKLLNANYELHFNNLSQEKTK